jgi:signal transduction histidine kinase
MKTDVDTHSSELKRRLLAKTAELDSALTSITQLAKKLQISSTSLQAAERRQTASDAAGVVRDAELKTAEDALIASDATLAIRSTELLAAVEKLAAANEQLRHSRDLQNAFIKIAAHELKNPIQPLLGIADILESSGADKDIIELSKSEVEIIVRNARRLDRLSNDILDVSRIESNSLKLKKETFDLNHEIRDVIRDFQMYRNKGPGVRIAFNPSIPKDAIMVHADKSRIYEVIYNILGNAIKFTAEGSITIISAIGAKGVAIVRIKDTGQGISTELLPDLFVKFGIANPSDIKSGSGLGLFISKGIIDAHGGKLWAENNKNEKGATFTFTIPAD